jgi:Protein of unknown function (DUF2569)
MVEVSQAPAVAEPKGIAGWLILPVIVTLLSPLMTAYAAFQDGVVLLNASLPTALAVFIVIEFLYNFGLMTSWIFAAVLLFKHKRLYPRLFVTLLVTTLIGTVLDLVIAATVFDIKLDSSDIRSALRSAVQLAIWGPYMHKSVRVKNTFVAG